MFISIFGDLDYGDRASLLDWMAAHDLSHRQIKQALSQVGATIQSVILGGDVINNDWFGMHGLSHVAIARSVPGVTSESASLLATNEGDWSSQNKFYNWHQNHDLLHDRINAVLGTIA